MRHLVAAVLLGVALVGAPTRQAVASPPPPPNCLVPAGAGVPNPSGYFDGDAMLSANGQHSLATLNSPGTSSVIVQHRDLVLGTVSSVTLDTGRLVDVTPDGHYALYVRQVFGGPQLARIDLTAMTSVVVPMVGWTLASTTQVTHQGVLSADGSKVATQARSSANGADEVIVVGVSNGVVTQVTTSPPPGPGFHSSYLDGMSRDANIVVSFVPGGTRTVHNLGGARRRCRRRQQS